MIVSDESIPLEGANVALMSTPAVQTKSDLGGRFTFNDVKPGAYNVFVEKIGYGSGSRRVDVLAGVVTHVNFTLTSVPIEVRHHLSDMKQGRLGCSYYTPVPVSGVGWTYCRAEVIDAVGWQHIPCITFNVTKGVTWRLGELVWTGNGPGAASQLWLGEYNKERSGWSPGYRQGASPVKVSSDTDRAFKGGAAPSEWCVFIASATPVNVAFDQPFTLHFTAFYHHEDIPDDFTAIK